MNTSLYSGPAMLCPRGTFQNKVRNPRGAKELLDGMEKVRINTHRHAPYFSLSTGCLCRSSLFRCCRLRPPSL